MFLRFHFVRGSGHEFKFNLGIKSLTPSGYSRQSSHLYYVTHVITHQRETKKPCPWVSLEVVTKPEKLMSGFLDTACH